MKKIVSVLVILLLSGLTLTPAFAAQKPLLVDNVGFLSEEEANTVEAKLESVSEQTNMDFVIVTTDNLEGKSKMEYADDFYDYNGYGESRRGDRSGALLLVYYNGYDTERWISTRGYGITAFTDYGIQYIGKQLVPLMDDDEWEEAFLKYADLSLDLVGRADEGAPLDVNNAPKEHDVYKGIAIALVVGLVIAFIVKASIKSRYKPVRFQPNASDYLIPGSLQVTGSYDNFRTTSVTRTQIKSESSSGGSSTHSSSSGASHGGGGF